jgi:hypothetical protein
VRKDIIGDWGSGLSDGDYACALAALGVLEATGSEQHRASSDPVELLAALRMEFRNGERTPVWRESQNVGRATTVASWRETIHVDAAALAAAWRRYVGECRHPRQRPRLAVLADWRARGDLFDFDALWAWLNHRDNGLQALLVADGRASLAQARWHWPLQVGTVAGVEGDAILATLRQARSQKSWVAQLSQCYTVGTARDACDLLLLTPAAAEAILAQPRSRLRASFVVCLEDQPLDPAPLTVRYSALRERLRAAGVAAVRLSGPRIPLADWFIAVLREASHDLPIHAAVWGTGQWRFGLEQFLLGDPATLDRCRILSVAERQDRIVEALAPATASGDLLTQPQATPGIDVDAMPTFGGPAGGDDVSASAPPAAAPSTPITQRNLADALRSREFVAETVDGVETVRELAVQQGEIEQAQVPRWVQASAWRPDTPEILARALAPRQWNLLGVHIGPTDVQRVDIPFPDDQVDFSRGDVVVSVQVELAGARLTALDAADVKRMFKGELRPADMRDGGETAGKLLRGPLATLPVESERTKDAIVGLAATTMVLPPAGDSTLALFAVCPEAGTEITGRIAIIHGNRVLQTARLTVGVGPTTTGSGLEVVADAPIHPRDDDLDERREYDVAIQLSDVGGKLHLKVHRNGRDTNVQLDAMQGPIERIQRGLENAAASWDYSLPVLQQRVLASSLRTLAAAGSELEQHLRKTCGEEIDHWERIHLVPYTNEFLPLEYVFGGPPPRMKATPCPNLLGALDRGACERAVGGDPPASCPNAKDEHYTCPMHFWGFRRLIERNGALRPTGSAAATSPETPVSTPSRRPYRHVGSLLFAASQRAFRYEKESTAQAAERAALVKALGVLGGTVTDVADWDQWREAVKAQPDLLVLVTHTDFVDETPVLEIGDGDFLGKQEITPKLSGAAGAPQLLLLLGCSTADVTESFQPYPERFRDAGVSIVVAPVAPIRGKDAVPIAKQLAKRLADCLAKSEATTFGELLPLLRRELLLAGHPGVMGLVGFGDGDWLLGGQ